MAIHQDQSASATRPRRRLWIVLAFVLLGLGVAFLVTAEVLIHRATPILRSRVVNTLSTRFDSRVELADFDISIWRGIEVTGKGLKLYPHGLNTAGGQDQAIFSVGEFRFRTRLWNLLRSPMHISEVWLSDLTIYKPTREQRQRLADADSASAQQARGERVKNKIEIYAEQILIDRARLTLGTDKPGKQPLEFNIQSVRLEDVGPGVSKDQPLRFHATLVNPKPVGAIESSGYFGPYDVHEPGNSAVRGDYRFSHADLSTIKGISGMLSSTGRYSGQLSRITVDGTTDTPDFSLDTGGQKLPLHTDFHAIVDGMNGNTYLQPVNATLAHSHIVARGEVVRAPKPEQPGQFGRRVQLEISVAPADIADMLRLAIKTSPPVLRHGALQLSANLDLPPGPATVTHRMHLKGRFTIHNATFSNEKTQADLEQLSLRGEGRPQDAKTASVEGLHSVASQMQGNFDLADARMTLTGLDYSVPGAEIALNGVYSLDGSQFDFHGTARLEAKLSQMVTGWRSLLLMPANHFFAKHGAGTEVPFTISGTRAEPKFGLDLFHHDKQPANSVAPPRP